MKIIERNKADLFQKEWIGQTEKLIDTPAVQHPVLILVLVKKIWLCLVKNEVKQREQRLANLSNMVDILQHFQHFHSSKTLAVQA